MIKPPGEAGLPAIDVYFSAYALDSANRELTDFRYDIEVIAHLVTVLTGQPDVLENGLSIILYDRSEFPEDPALDLAAEEDLEVFDVAYLGRKNAIPADQHRLGNFVLGISVDSWDDLALAYGLMDDLAHMQEIERPEVELARGEQRLMDGSAVLAAGLVALASKGLTNEFLPGTVVGSAGLIAYTLMRLRSIKRQRAIEAEISSRPRPLDDKGEARLPFTAVRK